MSWKVVGKKGKAAEVEEADRKISKLGKLDFSLRM